MTPQDMTAHKPNTRFNQINDIQLSEKQEAVRMCSQNQPLRSLDNGMQVRWQKRDDIKVN